MGQCINALFAPITTLLEATTGRLYEPTTVLVDDDATRVQACSDTMDTTNIPAPDTGS
ncbi:hypothetical protein D3C71_2157860 [compost metagenome]